MNKSESTADQKPVSEAEARALFAGLDRATALVLAVSGGPDSTALLALIGRWRAALANGPELLAVTVDHRLRPHSAKEARAVKAFARVLGVPHRTLAWTDEKPSAALQEMARAARYRLLIGAARRFGASHIVTAHTLDDQAETMLIRMARGSGLTGLCAMARETKLHNVILARPFLDIPKARLLATLEAQRVSFVRDPSNEDPRFTRARLRRLMPGLAAEGLDAARLALLARRLRRAEEAVEMAVNVAVPTVSERPWAEREPIVLDADRFCALPAEIALRLLGRAVENHAHEGPVQLAKLEVLCDAITVARRVRVARLRRTLAGALITLTPGRLVVEGAPPRQSRRRGVRP